MTGQCAYYVLLRHGTLQRQCESRIRMPGFLELAGGPDIKIYLKKA